MLNTVLNIILETTGNIASDSDAKYVCSQHFVVTLKLLKQDDSYREAQNMTDGSTIARFISIIENGEV